MTLLFPNYRKGGMGRFPNLKFDAVRDNCAGDLERFAKSHPPIHDAVSVVLTASAGSRFRDPLG
jgi:hypothetical protein